MSTRRGILASTPVVFAAAMFAISACGSSSPSGTVATPTFSPGGGAVNAGQTVTISTTTANATIFYTVDGTQPGTAVTGTTAKYAAPISITAATTIKAVATAAGFNQSTVASAAYTISTVQMAATPSFNPPAGVITSGTTVAIGTTTPNATIYYTTDGTQPGPTTSKYTAPIPITAAVTIKAVATASGFANSAVASAAYTLAATPTADTPTFGPAAGAVASGTMVTISTTTAGATIYYTTDGTMPGSSATPYTGPIAITGAVTIKAIATASGVANSAIASAAYTVVAVTPTFSPAAGAVASGTMVTISTTTAGATIYYTTDGTAPGASSTQYTGPVAITAATTIKAIATATGYDDSAIASSSYTIATVEMAATPTFNPAGGAVPSGTTVTLDTTTAGATIYYTTDGTAPGISSTIYTAPIAITAATTINAVATGPGLANSAVGVAAYTILAPAATPTLSPGSGAVFSGRLVSISATTAGATIYYTTDGTNPGPSSTQYTAPIAITAATTIKAVATAPGFAASAIASATYTVLVPAATPTFNPAAGTVTAGTAVTISTTTASAAIFYTTDGTQPATSVGGTTLLYSGPVSITMTTTINAIAIAPTFATSAVGSATYGVLPLAAKPTFSPTAGAVLAGTMVMISTTTAGATIYYTTDGTNPGPSSTQYTAPIAIAAATTIKAVATAPGFSDSAVGTAAYTIVALAATPTFGPGAGAVISGTSVSISTTTAGATIYYTTDGTDPGPATTQYAGPIAITAATTIKAMATAPGFAGSNVGSATYTILPPAATPTFSPLAGAVSAGSLVTISTTTASATIFYTTDGTQPATAAGGSTQLYGGPVSIATAKTINAIAVAPNFDTSAVGSAAYTILVLTPAATPTFSPAAGVVSSGTTVTLGSTTAGAAIYYTTDGTQPGTSAGGSTSLYGAPIAITAATTINAIAVASGFMTSAVASAAYTLTPAATPVFAPDPAAGAVAVGTTVTISSTTPSAAIYYTTDGTQPGTSAGGSTLLLYAPIAINAATTINAVATATGFAASAVVTAAYTLLPSAATPTFNPPQGGVILGTQVMISSTTAGATIYYTTDGTQPGTSVGGSTLLYGAPIVITAATTLKAIAIASGFATFGDRDGVLHAELDRRAELQYGHERGPAPGDRQLQRDRRDREPDRPGRRRHGAHQGPRRRGHQLQRGPDGAGHLAEPALHVCEVAVRLLRGQLGRGLQARLSVRLQHRLRVEQPIHHDGWIEQSDRGDTTGIPIGQQGSMGDRHRGSDRHAALGHDELADPDRRDRRRYDVLRAGRVGAERLGILHRQHSGRRREQCLHDPARLRGNGPDNRNDQFQRQARHRGHHRLRDDGRERRQSQ